MKTSNVNTLVTLLKSHKPADQAEAAKIAQGCSWLKKPTTPRGERRREAEVREACVKLAIPLLTKVKPLNLRSHADFEKFGLKEAVAAIRKLDIKTYEDYEKFGVDGAAAAIRERDSSGGYRLKTAQDFARIGLGSNAVIKRLDLRTYEDYQRLGPDAAADQLFLHYPNDPTNVRYELGKRFDPRESPPVALSFQELQNITMRAYNRQN